MSTNASDTPSATVEKCWLVVLLVAQGVTLWLTWPVWSARTLPPNLPLLDNLPSFSMGWWLIGSLALATLWPKPGVTTHVGLLLVAIALDQTREQPHVLCLAVLMVPIAFDRLRWTAPWFLANLWFWAGLHKLLSPDWFEQVSFQLSQLIFRDAENWYGLVAMLVPGYEILLGSLALFRPRWSAVLCIPLHLGIALMLSPLWAAWNYEVIPWNLALSCVAPWLLFQVRAPLEQLCGLTDSTERTRLPNNQVALRSSQKLSLESLSLASSRTSAFVSVAIAVCWLIYPAGYYWGLVDRYCAFVLYTDHMPRGVITTPGANWEIQTNELQCSFPAERRMLRQYFQRVGWRGWKLHIDDPRDQLADEYWLHLGNDQPAKLMPLTREQYLSDAAINVPGQSPDRSITTMGGALSDDRRCIFRLALAGVRMLKRHQDSMVYAVEINPEVYRPELLVLLRGLPNLEQLQLSGCPIDQAASQRIPPLPKLKIIEGLPQASTAVP